MNLILCALLMLTQGQGKTERVWVNLWEDRIDEGELVLEVDGSVCYKTLRRTDDKVVYSLNSTTKDKVFYSKKSAIAHAIDKMSEYREEKEN